MTDLLDEYDVDDNFDSDCIHENLFLSLTNNPSPEEIENLKETITSLNKSFYLAIPPHVSFNLNDLLEYITTINKIIYFYLVVG